MQVIQVTLAQIVVVAILGLGVGIFFGFRLGESALARKLVLHVPRNKILLHGETIFRGEHRIIYKDGARHSIDPVPQTTSVETDLERMLGRSIPQPRIVDPSEPDDKNDMTHIYRQLGTRGQKLVPSARDNNDGG